MSQKKKIKIKVDSEEAKHTTEKEELNQQNKEISENSENSAEEVALEDPIKELEAKLNATREEAKEAYDRLLRVSAEFENYKKRSARDLDDFRKFANQSLLKEMLLVVDNLELAVNSANENQNKDNSLKAGLDLTHKEILRVFNKFSVTPIESKGANMSS